MTERSCLNEHACKYSYSLIIISFFHFSGVHFYAALLNLQNSSLILIFQNLYKSYFKYSSCSFFVSSLVFKQLWQRMVRNSAPFFVLLQA